MAKDKSLGSTKDPKDQRSPENIEQTYRYRGLRSLEYILTYLLIACNPFIAVLIQLPSITPY